MLGNLDFIIRGKCLESVLNPGKREHFIRSWLCRGISRLFMTEHTIIKYFVRSKYEICSRNA